MVNEISIKSIDNDNYAIMAKAMGVSLDKESGGSTSVKLPRLRIVNQPIMKDSKINGKKVKEEIMEAGHFELKLPDDENVFYGKNIEIRLFMQRFMYKKWIPFANKYEKTVFSDNLNIDLKDTMGTFNLGRPQGFQKDWSSLPDATKDIIKSVKRVRGIFGKVKFIGKVVDSSLEEVKSQETPFIWEIHNATGFKNMGVPISTLAKMQKIPVNHYISVGTDEQTIPSGNSFYVPVASLDLTRTADITDNDQILFTQFQEFVTNYNGWVVSEWDKFVASEDISDQDKDIVNEFVDVELSTDEK